MIRMFSNIPAITAAAIGEIGNQLTFSFPEVLEVIKLCSANEIAVLGLELLEAHPEGGYATKNYSLYDRGLKIPLAIEDWAAYVRECNSLAEKFVHLNPAGDGHVYILSASSWEEFCEIQRPGTQQSR